MMLLDQPGKILPPILIIYTCIKILLMPSYRSTDFDVHRNWLAVTYNLPIAEWYFDDVNGTTVHTLDYPPAFAYFEWMLSNNPITYQLFSASSSSSLLSEKEDRCLHLLPDSDNVPSDLCIIFHRSTVILSDIVLWIGAYIACHAMYQRQALRYTVSTFLLIVLNPGLLWLDHIHFQYNGMLLGILLASLGLLMKANNCRENYSTTNGSSILYDCYTLGGAVLYALLINLKHLYLPLAPIYFIYLLTNYCYDNNSNDQRQQKFHVQRFLLLAFVTGFTLLLPWVPFILLQDDDGNHHPKKQQVLLQIFSRLFPFGRGLVHDYWAANVWSIYMLIQKILRFIASKTNILSNIPSMDIITNLLLSEPSPLICAIFLFLSLLPGMVQVATLSPSMSLRRPRRQGEVETMQNYINNKKLIQVIVFSSLCSFMLAYHVHEKAILTALIPLTLLVYVDDGKKTTSSTSSNGRDTNLHESLFWQISLWGLLGLFPLLFRPIELTFKLVSYIIYFLFYSALLKLTARTINTTPTTASSSKHDISSIRFVCCLLVGMIVLILEFFPIPGKWEFMPLLVTSISCAVALITCWIAMLGLVMVKE